MNYEALHMIKNALCHDLRNNIRNIYKNIMNLWAMINFFFLLNRPVRIKILNFPNRLYYFYPDPVENSWNKSQTVKTEKKGVNKCETFLT